MSVIYARIIAEIEACGGEVISGLIAAEVPLDCLQRYSSGTRQTEEH